jgi:hypothetical protein
MKQLLTEEAAKLFRCCGPPNVGEQQGNLRFCFGARCIAWRWMQEKEPLSNEEIKNAGLAVGLAQALKPNVKLPRGYCGLAGRPE